MSEDTNRGIVSCFGDLATAAGAVAHCGGVSAAVAVVADRAAGAAVGETVAVVAAVAVAVVDCTQSSLWTGGSVTSCEKSCHMTLHKCHVAFSVTQH